MIGGTHNLGVLMKLVVLVDTDDDASFHNMIKLAQLNGKHVREVETKHLSEDNEYDILSAMMQSIKDMKFDCLLARFSGREKVARNLGEEFPDMIIPISDNESSKNYVSNAKVVIQELFNLC